MLIHEQKKNNELKEKVLNDVGNHFNAVYYIYKDKYNKKINSLNTENREKFDYKKLRLIDDYEYLSEEEQQQQTSKKCNEKESLN